MTPETLNGSPACHHSHREHSSLLLRIVLWYTVATTLWIYFSDRALLFFTTDPHTLTTWSTIKGWTFVAVTSTILYFILKRIMLRIEQMNTALAESERVFRTLFETSQDALSISDENGLIDANDSAVKIFGCASREELIAYHPGQLSPPFQPDGKDSVAAAKERLATAIAEGSQFFEWTHRRIDGTVFPAEIMLSRFELRGRPVLQATIRDITERRRVQEALQASEAKFKNLVEHLPLPLFVKDRNSVFVFCNQAYASELGMKPEDIAGKTDFDFSPREMAEKYRKDDNWVITTGQTQSNEERNVHMGREKWVRATKAPYRDELGNIVGVMLWYEDISARREAESQLRKLSQAVEQSPASVVITNTRGNIEYVNPKFTEVSGYTSAEAIGKNPREKCRWKLTGRCGRRSQRGRRGRGNCATAGRTVSFSGRWPRFLHSPTKAGR